MRANYGLGFPPSLNHLNEAHDSPGRVGPTGSITANAFGRNNSLESIARQYRDNHSSVSQAMTADQARSHSSYFNRINQSSNNNQSGVGGILFNPTSISEFFSRCGKIRGVFVDNQQ